MLEGRSNGRPQDRLQEGVAMGMRRGADVMFG
jgi:hypothetical protein